MGVLSEIIRYKELEAEKTRADIGMISNAVANFQQSKQNNLFMQMEKKKLDVDLGTKGLRFSDEGQIVPATNLIESLGQTKEWKPRTKEEAFEFEKTKKGNEWKPSSKEEAFEFEALRKEPKGWKPGTKEEAFEFEKVKNKPIAQSDEFEESIKDKISSGELLSSEETDYYNKFMWKTGQALKMPKKDKFGFMMGDKQKGYKYIGNNQWKKTQ